MGRAINLIKRPVILVLNAFSKWKRERKWLSQTKHWRKVLEPKETETLDVTAKYLILAPHADDEWIGCSQIIKQCEKTIILNMDMPGGDSVEMHAERFKELCVLSNKYNRKLITIGKNKSESLSALIQDINPDYICLPHFFDWHPEHIQVMQYLRQSLSSASFSGKVLMYQVSLPMNPDFVDLCVPVSKADLMDKWKVFEDVYRTQTIISYQRFMANEKINGVLSDSFAAEVYSIAEVDIWLNEFDKLVLTPSEIIEVKSYLTDITLTRNSLKKFYEVRRSIS